MQIQFVRRTQDCSTEGSGFAEEDAFSAVSHHVAVWFVHTEEEALKIEVFLPGWTALRCAIPDREVWPGLYVALSDSSVFAAFSSSLGFR